MADPPNWYVDIEGTDDWVDKPRPRYGGKTMTEIAEEREAAGLPPEEIIPIPPPVPNRDG